MAQPRSQCSFPNARDRGSARARASHTVGVIHEGRSETGSWGFLGAWRGLRAGLGAEFVVAGGLMGASRTRPSPAPSPVSVPAFSACFPKRAGESETETSAIHIS